MTDWSDRFYVLIECQDCGQQFRAHNPDVSCERVGSFSRVVMFSAPENCPECRNMKVLK